MYCLYREFAYVPLAYHFFPSSDTGTLHHKASSESPPLPTQQPRPPPSLHPPPSSLPPPTLTQPPPPPSSSLPPPTLTQPLPPPSSSHPPPTLTQPLPPSHPHTVASASGSSLAAAGSATDTLPVQPQKAGPSLLGHNGPNCYVKPPAKSNKKLIRNALCSVCLAGNVNLSAKQRALAVSMHILVAVSAAL